MAPIISQEIEGRRGISAHIGRQILDVITSGMYSDPRMALREYVQNSADSIDAAIKEGVCLEAEGSITITLDGKTRSILVEDNGLGIKNGDVETRLGGLGCSSKGGGGHRGFRGIGRLGGLAYCDLLRFETRSDAREKVAVIEWSGQALREQVDSAKGHEQVEAAIRRIATLHFRGADKQVDPAHFCRVEMVNVHRFHADVLMNLKGLREYLSQIVPAPYDRNEFRFADKIERHLSEISGYRSYSITLNGTPIVRPYHERVVLRAEHEDRIMDVKLLELKTPDGRLICRGWYAVTQFMSAMPPHVTMRGLRVRQGNIGVGDEDFLKASFIEPRFATWHIGELHVGEGLKLNARRDGFEESPEYELFLEWSSGVCRLLSSFCRQSSKERSDKQLQLRVGMAMDQLFENTFFLDEGHKTAAIKAAEMQLAQLRKMNPVSEVSKKLVNDYEARVSALRQKSMFLSEVLDGRSIGRKGGEQVLSEVCKRILEAVPGIAGTTLLREIVAPYVREHKANS
jgi:hypothetical protein